MTEYTAIPTEVLEAQQTKGVHDIINNAHRAKSLREEEQEEARQAAIDTRDEQAAAMLRLAVELTGGITAIATLVFLAHVGAVAGWLMHLSTMALAFWLGYEIGKTIN